MENTPVKTFKHLFRSIPLLRRLDDWSDTKTGKTICYAIIALFIVMVIVERAIPAR